jgi:DNA-binding CsgD family transcriptional regulator/tetratricopeptide (TPR) repeat protein
VTTRVTSARLVGRERELAELEAALADAGAGRPSIAFVAGESGVGKTRLLSELVRRVEVGDPPARVIGGDCVELGEGELPYAPLVAALRPLARAQDPVLDCISAAARDELGALLPGLGPAVSDEGAGERDDVAQARLFEALLELFDELGREQPLLVTIEDLHWADRSTRAFLAFLARSLAHERVLVVATYRPDELHRRHPLRPLLAELERNATARRIELPPLSRDELGEQLTDILGARPDSGLTERLWTRSEGNPLFTEELLAAGLDGRGALPPTLRDALMVRIERLGEDAQDVLRLIAAGRRLDHALLSDASGLEPGMLLVALRESVASHIVAADEDGFYAFRHALLREVVHDDLLPGEHSEVHLALAQALERRAEQQGGSVYLAAGIAHHYFVAGHQAAALAASVRAASAAERVHAYGEAAALLERALELWDRVADPETLAGTDRVELLRRAAVAHQGQGDIARQEPLLRRALALVDEDAEPQRAAGLLEHLARAEWALNRGADAIETAQRGLALLAAGQPSHERARLLSWLAKARMLQGRYLQALELAGEAIEAAKSAGDTLAEGRARNARGISMVGLGDVEPGTGELRRAIEIARERENIPELQSAYANLADALSTSGRTREALAVVEQGRRAVSEIARPGDWLSVMTAEFKWLLGDWSGAEASMPPSERRHVGTTLMYVLLQRATMALGRGDHAAAREHLSQAEPFMAESSEPQFLGVCGALLALLAVREGDIESARRAVDEALDRIEFCTEDASRIVRLSAIGVAIEAEATERARDLGESPAFAESRVEAMLARVRAAAAGERPVERAWLAMAEAEATRVSGEPDPERWAAAASAWDALEWPYEAALARWRRAEAHVNAGDRDAATASAATAVSAARRLGAGWLEREVEGLAARARLRLEPEARAGEPEPARTPAEDPFGLTPRERQVLALVTEGMTNREIGERLFMAEKTASVHVSRILAKLNVRTRTEAAAVAHRLGLDASDLPRASA